MDFWMLLVGYLICGVHGRRIKRIIGGENTMIESVPYMLSLRRNGQHICGAAIIGKEWSLTAAHCCIDYTKDRMKILSMRSGGANLQEGGTVHQVVDVVRNDRYQDNNDDYDICAVRVSPSFEYTNSTRSVKLPDPKIAPDTSLGLVSGWGYSQLDEEKLSSTLQSINVSRVDLEHCKYLYRNKYTIHDRNICYGSGEDSKDACQGDSGGPLVNQNFTLIGIVSFGDDCGYSTLPGIYTDIVQFRNWIRVTTNI